MMSHNEIQIAVLITSYNRRESTLACLSCLMQQRFLRNIKIKIYLVDDQSPDGTSEAVKKLFPQVHLIQGTGSLYWGGGMRKAFETAMKEAADFYLWLNDDVLLKDQAIKSLLKTYKNLIVKGLPKSIVVGAVQDPKSGKINYSGYVRGPWFRPLKFHMISPAHTPLECDTMNGNCVLIPEQVARLIENIDPLFTHTMGDFDYALRARQKGCQVWVAPHVVGTCERILNHDAWDSSGICFKLRLKKVNQVKEGLPFAQWKEFCRRHGGVFWFFYWAASYRKLFRLR